MGRYTDLDDLDDPDDPVNQVGQVEARVRQDLDALITTHPMGEGLSAMALHLAHTLDHADAMFRAALSRELRGILEDLAEHSATTDDGDLTQGLSGPTMTEPPRVDDD
jgi:hypothetical protein